MSNAETREPEIQLKPVKASIWKKLTCLAFGHIPLSDFYGKVLCWRCLRPVSGKAKMSFEEYMKQRGMI